MSQPHPGRAKASLRCQPGSKYLLRVLAVDEFPSEPESEEYIAYGYAVAESINQLAAAIARHTGTDMVTDTAVFHGVEQC